MQHNFKHGLGKTKEYRTWSGMRSRCFYKKNKDYKNYGAKGITVCKRWDNFLFFLSGYGEMSSR